MFGGDSWWRRTAVASLIYCVVIHVTVLGSKGLFDHMSQRARPDWWQTPVIYFQCCYYWLITATFWTGKERVSGFGHLCDEHWGPAFYGDVKVFLWLTCFKGELILFLAVIIIEGPDADPSPSAGIILERIPIPTILISRVRSGLLIIGPLGRVSLVFLIAAHAGGQRCRMRSTPELTWYKHFYCEKIENSRLLDLTVTCESVQLQQ